MATTFTVPFGGMRIDRLAAKVLGTANGGAVEQLLDANAGLAAVADLVPEGTVIVVPELVKEAEDTQRVWE